MDREDCRKIMGKWPCRALLRLTLLYAERAFRGHLRGEAVEEAFERCQDTLKGEASLGWDWSYTSAEVARCDPEHANNWRGRYGVLRYACEAAEATMFYADAKGDDWDLGERERRDRLRYKHDEVIGAAIGATEAALDLGWDVYEVADFMLYARFPTAYKRLPADYRDAALAALAVGHYEVAAALVRRAP